LMSQFSIRYTFSIPSMTSPKTAWLPSSQGVGTVVRKNCEPPVFGPALAIENSPGRSWRLARADGSHGIFHPGPPVPARPLLGSLE